MQMRMDMDMDMEEGGHGDGAMLVCTRATLHLDVCDYPCTCVGTQLHVYTEVRSHATITSNLQINNLEMLGFDPSGCLLSKDEFAPDRGKPKQISTQDSYVYESLCESATNACMHVRSHVREPRLDRRQSYIHKMCAYII